MSSSECQTAAFGRRVRIAPDVLWRTVDDEAVLLELRRGEYYGLDAIGTRFWSLLLDAGDVEGALRALVSEFDAPPERLSRDLAAFVGELSSRGLVVVDAA